MTEYNNDLKRIIDKARQIHMSAQDKATIRESLIRRIEMMPIKSPYIFSIQTFLVNRFAVLTVAMLMIGSGALSYASNESLPGEKLYPLKVGVAEPVEEFLILSEKSKAKYEVKLVSRRLSEATLLARDGKLDPVTSTELQAGIMEHVENATTHAKELAKNQDSVGAKEVSAELEGSLALHSASLTVIADTQPPQENNTVAPLLVTLKQQVQVAQESTARVEVEIASHQDETTTDLLGDITIDANTDFEDTEALDDIGIDYLSGESTYKDELMITDGETVPDSIDAPETPVKNEVKGEVISNEDIPSPEMTTDQSVSVPIKNTGGKTIDSVPPQTPNLKNTF